MGASRHDLGGSGVPWTLWHGCLEDKVQTAGVSYDAIASAAGCPISDLSSRVPCEVEAGKFWNRRFAKFIGPDQAGGEHLVEGSAAMEVASANSNYKQTKAALPNRVSPDTLAPTRIHQPADSWKWQQTCASDSSLIWPFLAAGKSTFSCIRCWGWLSRVLFHLLHTWSGNKQPLKSSKHVPDTRWLNSKHLTSPASGTSCNAIAVAAKPLRLVS